MAKEFNTTGNCIPSRHYMVDITDKLDKIVELIDKGKYFTINRARQFGKTTTMKLLLNRLQDDYVVYQISFETDGDMFSSQEDFCRGLFLKLSKASYISEGQKTFWKNEHNCKTFEDLSNVISEFCLSQSKPVVLMIDEVDKSTDNQLFLHFLGLLRNKYLDRAECGMNSTFHSVILAGVYDVKNLKLKIRNDEERKYNSPWNIATDFFVDMSLPVNGIKGMLDEYESDYHTGMDTQLIANEIRRLTSGYPFLVSKLCELIETRLGRDWTLSGVENAAKMVIKSDQSTLIDDLIKNVEQYPKLKMLLRSMLLEGFNMVYEPNNEVIKLASLFSILKQDGEGRLMIHNIIFQQVLYNYFIAEKTLDSLFDAGPRSMYVKNGKLNMAFVVDRFKDLMREEYRDKNQKFMEEQGRLLFLCFLKPIINGTGFYYVEPETCNSQRMDIVVNYGGEEFVIELKLWYGRKYEEKGIDQISEYLNVRRKKEGYLITFSFLKDKVVQEEPEWVEHEGKRIYEAII